jgi:hypothetical protein
MNTRYITSRSIVKKFQILIFEIREKNSVGVFKMYVLCYVFGLNKLIFHSKSFAQMKYSLFCSHNFDVLPRFKVD